MNEKDAAMLNQIKNYAQELREQIQEDQHMVRAHRSERNYVLAAQYNAYAVVGQRVHHEVKNISNICTTATQIKTLVRQLIKDLKDSIKANNKFIKDCARSNEFIKAAAVQDTNDALQQSIQDLQDILF